MVCQILEIPDERKQAMFGGKRSHQ